MNRAERIERALRGAFAYATIEVQDDSAKHAGHAGAQPGGETHYTVRIVAAAFEGLSRVERHRLVHAALTTEFDTGLHALAIVAKTTGEAEVN
jgi:BolA family transcriptional regulator, general stress-responsive regulator